MGWEWRAFFAADGGSRAFSVFESELFSRDGGSSVDSLILNSSPEVRSDVYLVVDPPCAGAKLRGGTQLEIKLCAARKKRLAERYTKHILPVVVESDRDNDRKGDYVATQDGQVDFVSAAAAVETFLAAPGVKGKLHCEHETHAVCSLRAKSDMEQQLQGQQLQDRPRDSSSTDEVSSPVAAAASASVRLVRLHKERHQTRLDNCIVEQVDIRVEIGLVARSSANRKEIRWQPYRETFRSVCVEGPNAGSIYKQIDRLLAATSPRLAERAKDKVLSKETTAEDYQLWFRQVLCQKTKALQTGDSDQPVPGLGEGIFGYPSFVADLVRQSSDEDTLLPPTLGKA